MYLLERKNFFLYHGILGLQSLSFGKLKYRQIEACRRTIRRGLRKKGKIFIRVFTGIPVSEKAKASRMGKGKGLRKY
jgi:large subunit ribosomal protein L16